MRTLGGTALAAAVLGLVVALTTLTPLEAAKRVPINRDDLVGSWVGLTSDDLEMVRLTFSDNGDGSLGYISLDNPPCVARLVSWSFHRGHLELELGNPPSCVRGRAFHGTVAGTTIRLIIEGEGWKRDAQLKKEAPLVRRWETLREAMSST